MMTLLLVLLCALLASPAWAKKSTDPGEPLHIGSRLELFVDDHLIDSMQGVELKLHSPRAAERILTLNKPWEGPTSDYISVIKDDDRYRMYYRGSTHAGKALTIPSLFEPGETLIADHRAVACYAESRDTTFAGTFRVRRLQGQQHRLEGCPCRPVPLLHGVQEQQP